MPNVAGSLFVMQQGLELANTQDNYAELIGVKNFMWWAWLALSQDSPIRHAQCKSFHNSKYAFHLLKTQTAEKFFRETSFP